MVAGGGGAFDLHALGAQSLTWRFIRNRPVMLDFKNIPGNVSFTGGLVCLFSVCICLI